MSTISVDIDLDDILHSMGKWDRVKLFESLQSDGYIPKECVVDFSTGELKLPERQQRKIDEESNDDFNIALKKLFNNGWKLTKEEEDYVINLSKRFV
jgi:hypothetical protein